MQFVRIVLAVVGVVLAAWVLGRLMFPVPDTEGRPVQTAIPFDPTTTFGPRAVEAAAAHPGQSGIIPLAQGVEALRARLLMANRAERSLDVMYYIWHDDISGMLLLDALRRASERGVRVRLLLDDNGIHGMDAMLAALDRLPDFDIRLFNPSTVRNPKMLGYVLMPLRMNRRMHNKAFIVDGAVAIVGGRNVGDAYFSVGDVPSYLDLDVIGTGRVVTDTARIFDAYWNSGPVLALDRVIEGPGDRAAFEAGLRAAQQSPDGQVILSDGPNPAARLFDAIPPLEWTQVQVVADDPAKGLGQVQRDQLMVSRLGEILGRVDRQLDLLSAYFVPGTAGTRFFSDLARRGVQVNIMTNAWVATDVPMVHAGYTKYRRELLEAGVSLYELRPIAGHVQGPQELSGLGTSGSSLHAKTFTVDQSRVFIGSFNFDPRSALLNCEMGFMIDSPNLGRAGAESLLDRLSLRSYRPMLRDGDMVWQGQGPHGQPQIWPHEPGLGIWDRVAVYVLNVLPIEWLL